ncbi:unnamed protein product [Cylicocyclus nassatus]|uniref:Uncharacterized protein n=1 Tax=Cylicocyclus nassatus TaxID=53992 RepID=A0AA36DW33_CYLNA|nr:unnamed protein product [Cylicocyclus nassatus]
MQQEAPNKPASTGPGPETPRKRHGRRAVVYHKESSAESIPLYPKSRSGTDSVEGYKKSLSDEYKRRAYEEAERNRERLYELGAGGYSIECYVASLAFTAAVIALLIVYIVNISQTSLKETVSHMSAAPDYTKSYVVMTENFDCSLLAKRAYLKSMETADSAIMCLTATVPYCVAGLYSSISSFYYLRLSIERAVRTWKRLMVPKQMKMWSKGFGLMRVVEISTADGSPKNVIYFEKFVREKWLRNKTKAVEANITNIKQQILTMRFHPKTMVLTIVKSWVWERRN